MVILKKEKKNYRVESSYNLEETQLWRDCPVQFEMGEEFFYYCKRRVIRYRDSFSNVDHKAVGPDIDAISFICFRVKKDTPNVFSALEEKNITSPLVQHFAAQERSSGNYTDPDTGSLLWRKRKVVEPMKKTIDEVEYDGVPFDKPNSVYVWLNGGLDSFLRIMRQDPKFLSCLIKALSLGFCDLTRLDLAVDFSENVMAHVTSSIVKGHYESASHPYGYGWLGGRSLRGGVGKKSKNASRFKEEHLILNTVYFGSPKSCDKVVAFYDKSEESLNRFDGRWPLNTRAEVRLLGRTPEIKAEMLEVLKSYNNSTDGWKLRMRVFVEALMGTVRFTTKKRLRGAEKTNKSGVAPWWLAVIGTLTQSFTEQNEIKKFNSLDGTIKEPELHSLLTTALKNRNESNSEKNENQIKFETILEEAQLLCDKMMFREFYRKKNLHRLFKNKSERDKVVNLTKPLFTAFEKKEKDKKKESENGKKNC